MEKRLERCVGRSSNMLDSVTYLCNCLRNHQLAIKNNTGCPVHGTGYVRKCFLSGNEIRNESPMIQTWEKKKWKIEYNMGGIANQSHMPLPS